MVVDCHTHIPFPADQTLMSEHLLAAQIVDKCFVLAAAEDGSEVNEKLSLYVNSIPQKMVGFAFVNPAKNNYNLKKLAQVTEKLQLSGIVVYCAQCGFHPADSRAMRLYEAAEQMKLPVFFHNGPVLSSEAFLEYAQPMLIDEVARTFNNLKIIIGDMGTPFLDQTLLMIAKHPNIYADLTINPARPWLTYNTIIAAYEAKVLEKLLFGSGFPFGKAGQNIEILLGFNKLLSDTNLPSVPRQDIRSIIDKNVIDLLEIPSKT
jgi:predicted TIM-barrel fold metal-dependent hydrolase